MNHFILFKNQIADQSKFVSICHGTANHRDLLLCSDYDMAGLPLANYLGVLSLRYGSGAFVHRKQNKQGKQKYKHVQLYGIK